MFQLKVIKTEAQVAEIQRRFEAAIKAADASKMDTLSAQRQYDAAKAKAEEEFRRQFPNG